VSAGGEHGGAPIRLHHALETIWQNPGGVGRLTIVNHSVVGIRFIVAGFTFFLIGGVLAMLIRAQLATSDNQFVDHDAYNQIFTMHGTVMMFLFTLPMIEGVALYLLPKLLGARDLAFPRLSAFGFFCLLFGGTILVGALAVGLAPDGGWFMYAPLSSRDFTPGINADVWLIGVTFVEISAVAVGIELIVTIFKIRAAGMALHRLPLFAWAMLVTAFMIVIGFPPLILGAIMLEVERAFDWPFFIVERGGDPLLWQHLFWLFGHPEVYIIFLPATGLVSMMIPTFARRPFVGYTAVVAALIAVGFISFALWVHHMYMAGLSHLALTLFSAASMLVAIPTAVQFFAWIATLWSGRPVMSLPMLYLFGFLFTFVFGGLTGVMLALVPFDWQVHDTHFVVAHLHYVLVGGFVFPLLAAAYYWLPLISGRMPSARLGHLAFWLIFFGFHATFFIMHFTGLKGMPRRVYTYHPAFGWDLFNLISSIGGFVMAAGFALFALDMVMQLRHGDRARRNPWAAGTLEWGMVTPPPVYNFASLPEVESRDPLWDQPSLAAEMAAGRHYLGLPRNGWQETLAVDALSGHPDHIVILPGRSWYPFLSACSLAVFFFFFLVGFYPVAIVGAGIATVLFLLWGWTNGLKQDPEPLPAGHGKLLVPHAASADAPGWWGTCITFLADGALLACLMFGYFFLWAVAPGWPPPSFIAPSLAIPALAAFGLAAGFLSSYGAVTANAKSGAGAAVPWLVGGLLAGLLGVAALLAIPIVAIEPPTTHAYHATIALMAIYAAFHAGVAVLLCAQAALRCIAGYVSPLRSLDLRVVRLWWGYTAGSGLLILLALYAMPVVVTP
jgi:cytochrome c oxidase subunit I+III